MDEILFRHNSFRPGQKELVFDIWQALKEKKNVLACAATGIGKTDASISTALSFAMQNDLNVFFLTPKISQHRIAVDVVSGLVDKYSLSLQGVDFVGRGNMCNEEVSLCDSSRRKKCPCFEKFSKHLDEGKIAHHNSIVHFSSFFEDCKKKNFCAYEFSLNRSKHSRFVVADFFHLFLPSVRNVFLGKIGKTLEKSIVIVDEAHNLNQRVLDSFSSKLSLPLIDRAQKEALAVKSSDCFSMLEDLKRQLKEMSFERLRDFRECFVEKDIIECKNWIFFDAVAMNYLEKENVKSCALSSIFNFFLNWYSVSNEYARILSLSDGLKVNCLESFDVPNVVNSAYATIAMSGTLLPLKMHAQILGFDLKKTFMREYSSPFPVENLSCTISLIF